MKWSLTLRGIALVWLCVVVGRADGPGPAQVIEVMARATSYLRSISTHGGYVGIYSLDLRERFGEAFYQPADTGEIWVQPPGTPSIGQVFLQAYRITRDNRYMAAAKDAARALAWGQRRAGGWDYLVKVSHLRPDSETPVRKKGRCTFDDNTTQSALNFLISLDEFIKEEWLSDAIQLGLVFMLESQYENGAWPQWYPYRGGFSDYFTFNDAVINDCIVVMLHAHTAYGVDEYLHSARLGGDFIMLSQIPDPQSGWAQQYSHDTRPAWGRSFEPPAVCSAVTARNIRTLVQLYHYTNEGKYLQPIPPAIDWLGRSKLGKNQWARFYELKTNRPIYCDKGRKIRYSYTEISEEIRRDYGWQGEFGVPQAIEQYRNVTSRGADVHLTHDSASLSTEERPRKAEDVRLRIEQIISSLDEDERWTRNGMIYAELFVENMNALCSYLEMLD